MRIDQSPNTHLRTTYISSICLQSHSSNSTFSLAKHALSSAPPERFPQSSYILVAASRMPNASCGEYDIYFKLQEKHFQPKYNKFQNKTLPQTPKLKIGKLGYVHSALK